MDCGSFGSAVLSALATAVLSATSTLSDGDLVTYAESLAEFRRVTGHKPGEMNKRISDCEEKARTEQQVPCFPATPSEIELYLPRFPGTSPKYSETVSLEPPSQSAGPGRCNRFTRAVALGDPTPCKLPANHEGPHEP